MFAEGRSYESYDDYEYEYEYEDSEKRKKRRRKRRQAPTAGKLYFYTFPVYHILQIAQISLMIKTIYCPFIHS